MIRPLVTATLCFALVPLLSGCESLAPRADAGTGGESPEGGGAIRPRFEDYIRGDRFPRLVLEIDAVDGFQPRASSQTGITSSLAALVSKPGGITVSASVSLTSVGPDHAWTFSELQGLATSTFDLVAPNDTIKMHVLFVDGHSADDTQNGKILGLAWAHTHLVIFKQTIEGSCRTGVPPLLADQVCADAEQGVWTHEIGHILGLVDNGLPMVTPHSDPAHGAHDHSNSCVMYWAYDTGSVLDEIRTRLTGGNTSQLDFDAECKNDIAAVRDR
jgi:hypothetical protein